MIKGLYTASSGMLANKRRLDIIANNLANASTSGYKRDEGIQQAFPEMLISRLEPGKNPKPIGELGTGVRLEEDYTDFKQGSLKETGNQLDVAIEGNGFFVLETPEGLRYTRNGNFTLNNQGQIVTQEGYLVQGERGPLQTVDGRKITIDEDGQLYLGELRGDRFLIVDFSDRSQLRKVGNNLYINEGEAEEMAETYNLHQGFLERSNVNIVQEMVRMIQTNRSFEANQKVIQSVDNTLDKAVNQVGNVQG